MSVLGPVRAWYGDRDLHLGPARQRTVFAVLAARANRILPRDELVTAVWGASPPATAVDNLYTYISGLRRSLTSGGAGPAAADVLASRPAGYILHLSRGDLDSERFGDLCAEAAALEKSGDLAAAADRLDAALRLWHGDAYADLSGDHVESHRAHLSGRRLAAVERRARILVELGDDALVADLAGLVHAHPLHEPLHELLMRALLRAGRPADAVEAYRAARRTLVAELGVEPGPALQAVHAQALREPMAKSVPARPSAVVPSTVARAIRGNRSDRPLYGRTDEVELLRGLLGAAAGGTGSAVWIEGEAGAGKTELLTHALAGAVDGGCHLLWAAAQEHDRHVPLQVLIRALGLDPKRTRPQGASVAAQVRAAPAADGATTVDQLGAAERIVAHLEVIGAAAPVVLVLDNLHLADDATLSLWQRLVEAAQGLPLLLVTATRPEPDRREHTRLRSGVEALRGHVLKLRPLSVAATEELVTTLVGAPIGPRLREFVSRWGRNPLYTRETVAALQRGGELRTEDGIAEIDVVRSIDVPEPLLATIEERLKVLTSGTRDLLRAATLLGDEFVAGDLGAVTGRSPYDLIAHVEEALAADILIDAGQGLAFQHPFLRRALYESMPPPSRARLHRRVAEILARGGSGVAGVVEQLAAGMPVVDDWVVGWLVEHEAEVRRRTPQAAGELIRRVLATTLPTPRQREILLIAVVKLDFRCGRYPVDEAREALEIATDPSDRAEMRQLLATMLVHNGDRTEGLALLTGAVNDPTTPTIWQTRHRVLLANFRRSDLSGQDRTDGTARRLHDEAVAAGEPYEAAFALQSRWLAGSIGRDHERALAYVDRALDLVRGDPQFAGMYLDLLDNRIFTLQNLDRLDEAELSLREAARFALRNRFPSALPVASAVQSYWRGRWDDALADISQVTEDAPGITFLGMREPDAVTMLLHGVAALIQVRRNDTGLAAAHLDAVDALPATDAERESYDFLLVAHALVAEQQGRAGDALDILAPLLAVEYAPMMLRHQWLPDVVRLALQAGRRDVAERAAEICAGEAARELAVARAFAADARCRALVTGDPAPALDAARHYRAVGRPPELAAALEDAATLLAARRLPLEAVRYGGEAADRYADLGARWDQHRLATRLAAYGVDVPGHSGTDCGAAWTGPVDRRSA